MKRLVGVIHLPPLPGSPRSTESAAACAKLAGADARILAEAGYDAIIVENFGDTPFFATKVPPITIAAMTACALAAKEAGALLGINVLRNDAEAALAVAIATEAAFVRINVHTGARVTDQGLVQGEAATTLRMRRALGSDVAIWADVDVKHSAPLGPARPLVQEVEDLTKRGMAEVVLVTGEGTGKGVDHEKLAAVKRATDKPVLVASGATLDTLAALSKISDGVIVGSALRKGGIPGGPIDRDLAKRFADAFRGAF